MAEATALEPGPSDDDLTACPRVLAALTRQPGLCDAGDPRCDAVRDHAARRLRALRSLRKTEGRERDRHLLRLLRSYFDYYHEARCHQTLGGMRRTGGRWSRRRGGRSSPCRWSAACTTAIGAASEAAVVRTRSPGCARDERNASLNPH